MKAKRSAKKPFALLLIRFIYRTFGPIFPSYFGSRAYQQWFTTMRFKTPAYEVKAADTAAHETLEVNSLPVTVYIWQHEKHKPEKTLLFIHGWAGRGTQVVNYIERLNELGYRVISFDGPAHGNTPGKQTSLLEFTDVVFALEKHYGRFDAALTHSFGGMILLFAMSLGLKLDRAACICPPKDFEVLTDNFQRILDLPQSVMKVLTRKTYESHGQVVRDAVCTVSNARKLDCAGLIIHDEDDEEIPWQGSEQITQAWQGARFIKTSGLGHRRIIHDKQVVDQIVDFMSEES